MPNTEAAEHWAAVAPAFIELEERLEEISGEPGRLAMDRLDLQPGQRVLDIGCGGGSTTLALAERVGPAGQVLGVDITDAMISRGRQRAAEAGKDNLSFLRADAQIHDFGEGEFARAYSRFGVMFFDDPVAAFANIRRALAPGGRLSFVCWQNIFANEWMLIPGAAAMTTLGVDPPPFDPDEPGPFTLADPDRARSVLAEAGFRDIDIALRNDTVSLEESRIREAAESSARVGLVSELLKEADDESRARVISAIEEAYRARLKDGVATAARGVLLVTAIA